ncbi:MAG: hypothetical protein ACRD8A_05455 [Candidatus Acidiferrales bacterium]
MRNNPRADSYLPVAAKTSPLAGLASKLEQMGIPSSLEGTKEIDREWRA